MIRIVYDKKCADIWGYFLIALVGLSLYLFLLDFSQEAIAIEVTIENLPTMVLANNFDIQLSQASKEEKQGALAISKGKFDTNFTYSFTINEKETPSSSSLDDAGNASSVKTKDKIQVLTLKKNFIFGTELTVPYTYKIADSNSVLKKIPESHEPSFELKLKQPFLKSWTPSYFTKDQQTAEINLKESIQKHREKISNTLRDSIDLFYDVIEATTLERIKVVALESSKRNYNFLQEKKLLGKASLIDVLDSESTYRRAEEDLHKQKNVLINKKEDLKLKIFGQKDDTGPLVLNLNPLVELTLPDLDNTHEMEKIIQEAYQKRTESKTQEYAYEKAKLQKNYSQVDLLTAVDLEFDVTYNGLNRDFSSSNKEILKREFPSWKTGITVDQPIMRYASRGNLNINILKLQQEEIKNNQNKRNIAFEIQKNVRDLKADWSRLKALEVALQAEQEKLNHMDLNFQLGKISSFDLNKHVQSKIQVEMEKLQAEISYRKRVYAFYLARGVLIEKTLEPFQGEQNL